MVKWNLRKRPKTGSPAQEANKNILKLTYLVAGVFLCMIVYLGYFLQVESEDVISNAYSAGPDSFANRVARRRILSNDGMVLMEMLADSDDNETRNYPYGPPFIRVVKYLTKGETGTEALSNFYLLASHVNLVERVVNELSGEKNPGDYVVTTLNVGLQRAVSDALGGRWGTVVVMEPDTGKVLTMISRPEYNPNTLIEDWDALTADGNADAQLINRATQGLCPPGSTLKPVTALGYIREHPDNRMNYGFNCDGYYQQGKHTIKCYHETAHRHQDLELAFANSCSGAFASLGFQPDLNRLKRTVEGLLFNQDLPLAIAYNRSSYSMEAGTGTWEILQTFIGQEATQMASMLGAVLASSIANGDTLIKPCFLGHVENVGGEATKEFMPAAYGRLMTAQESAILSDTMREVVTVGTGSAVRTDVYTVTGKTGSAEFDAKKETYGRFLGFIPAKNPKLVISVIVKGGDSGGKAAAPMARAVFGTYFSR